MSAAILEHMFDTFQSTPGGCALPGLSAAGVDCAALSAEQLVDVVAAVERLVAQAHGLQLTALAELGRRCAAAGAGEGHPSSEYVGALECAAAEVAPACRWTRTMAEHRVELAAQLEQRLPATLAALSEGRIDLNRARAMAEATEPLDADAAAVVEARVLARAGSQTAAQLRACLRRAVLAVDPVGAEHRHQVAVGKRRVEVRQLPDGVAELIAPCALTTPRRSTPGFQTLPGRCWPRTAPGRALVPTATARCMTTSPAWTVCAPTHWRG